MPTNQSRTYSLQQNQPGVNAALAADLHRSLNLVQVNDDRCSPLPRAAKLRELVRAQVAYGQRA